MRAQARTISPAIRLTRPFRSMTKKPEQGSATDADPALEMSRAFPYCPRCSRALRIGALETLIMPSSGWLISKITKIAPETFTVSLEASRRCRSGSRP
jgi:hypothetical protein